jgi:hypothetical protein
MVLVSLSRGRLIGRQHGTEDANLMGIVQALISIFAEDNDRIRSVLMWHG